MEVFRTDIINAYAIECDFEELKEITIALMERKTKKSAGMVRAIDNMLGADSGVFSDENG